MKNQNKKCSTWNKELTDTAFDLARLRGFRLFAVVFNTAQGANVYGIFSDPRQAREAKREFRKASEEICGQRIPAIIVPLEIPQPYFS